jgi:hypothetical protein
MSLSLSRSLYLVKWINAVFEASNTAPPSLSHLSSFSSFSSMSLWIILVFLSAELLTTYAVWSSTNAMDAPSLIAICNRSALKKRNRIGANGDPCGSPDWNRSSTSDVKPLTTTLAFLLLSMPTVYQKTKVRKKIRVVLAAGRHKASWRPGFTRDSASVAAL